MFSPLVYSVRRDRSFFFFQAEDGIRDVAVTGVQTCALPISTAALAQQEAHPHRGVPGAGAAVAREGREQLDDDRPITQCGRDIEAVAADPVIHGTLSHPLFRRDELPHPEKPELAPPLPWPSDLDDPAGCPPW